MAVKIPDAPNIVGSDIELRSPQMLQPVSNIPQFKVDLSGLQEFVGDATKYYQGMVRDQTNTYLTAGKNDYLQHMTSYQNDIFQQHQGKDARDLYARYIKKESDRWLAEKYGAPKDDGQIRIVDKELQDQFSRWVESQQPHFISSTANYEEKEWDVYRKTVFTARDNEAANLMLNATTPETIQNAINGYIENTYAANPGMDEQFIKQAIASKVDASIVGHLNKVALTEPMKAFEELNTYKPIVENLSDKSKQQVIESIRKSYKNIGIDEYAHADFGDGGSIGMVANEGALTAIFGNDWQDVQAEMISKGKERAEGLRKTQQGQHEAVVNIAMDKVLRAKNDTELADALTDLYAADQNAANSYINARDTWVAHQQDIDTAGLGAEQRISTIDERMKEFEGDKITGQLRPQVYNVLNGDLAYKQTIGFSEEDAARIKELTGLDVAQQQNFADLLTEEKSAELKKAWRTAVTDSDLNKIVEGMVAEEGELNRNRIEAAARIWKTSNTRQNQMPRYKELATRISNGEIRAYDAELMGDLDYPIQQQLSVLIDNNNRYLDTKNDLKAAGIDLDKVIQDNGIDAQYGKLDVGSQNLLKRNIVYEINAAKIRNQGKLPDADAINGIALRVQKNSVSPMMALVQDVSLAENMPSENLTNEQRLELGVRESISWDYNKPEKRGLDDQRKRAEAAIDRLSNSSRLSSAEQQYIKQNKVYLTSLYQAGDLAGMVDFMALATQGGF